MIGPSLPPSLITAKSTRPDDDPSNEPETVIGPQLPSIDKGSGTSIYGPALPPGITCGSSNPEEGKDIQGSDMIGEQAPRGP